MLTPRNSRIGALKEIGAYVHIKSFTLGKETISFYGLCLSETRVAILSKTDINPDVVTLLGITDDFSWSPEGRQEDPDFYKKIKEVIDELVVPLISEGRLLNDFFRKNFPHEKVDMSSL